MVMINNFKLVMVLTLVCPLMRGSSAEQLESSVVTEKQIVKGKDRPLTILLNRGFNYRDTIQVFVDNGADVFSPDSQGIIPFDSVVRIGGIESVKSLINRPDIFSPNSQGISPHHWILRLANTECTQLLLDKKMDPSQPDSKGIYPIMFAANRCNLNLVKLLVKYGAKPDVLDGAGCSLLRLAIAGTTLKEGSDAIAFIDYVPDFRPCTRGITPLMAAVNKNLGAEFVQALLNKRAPVNAVDETRQTALDYAVARWDCKKAGTLAMDRLMSVIEVLLRNGAWVDGHEPVEPLVVSKEIMLSTPAKGMKLSSASKKGSSYNPDDDVFIGID